MERALACCFRPIVVNNNAAKHQHLAVNGIANGGALPLPSSTTPSARPPRQPPLTHDHAARVITSAWVYYNLRMDAIDELRYRKHKRKLERVYAFFARIENKCARCMQRGWRTLQDERAATALAAELTTSVIRQAITVNDLERAAAGRQNCGRRPKRGRQNCGRRPRQRRLRRRPQPGPPRTPQQPRPPLQRPPPQKQLLQKPPQRPPPQKPPPQRPLPPRRRRESRRRKSLFRGRRGRRRKSRQRGRRRQSRQRGGRGEGGGGGEGEGGSEQGRGRGEGGGGEASECKGGR